MKLGSDQVDNGNDEQFNAVYGLVARFVVICGIIEEMMDAKSKTPFVE